MQVVDAVYTRTKLEEVLAQFAVRRAKFRCCLIGILFAFPMHVVRSLAGLEAVQLSYVVSQFNQKSTD